MVISGGVSGVRIQGKDLGVVPWVREAEACWMDSWIVWISILVLLFAVFVGICGMKHFGVNQRGEIRTDMVIR